MLVDRLLSTKHHETVLVQSTKHRGGGVGVGVGVELEEKPSLCRYYCVQYRETNVLQESLVQVQSCEFAAGCLASGRFLVLKWPKSDPGSLACRRVG